ncbi:MAG: NADH-quinone oxidoreductase subunit L [Candidatus Methanomethylicaceae archaeon]|jgi:NADH-quinone oxidoreductase subunit L
MPLDLNIISWLCWIFPTVGSIFPLALRGRKSWVKGLPVVLFSFLSLVMALLMLPNLFGGGYSDIKLFWFSLPNGGSVGLGMLVDPLSIIVVNIVAFLSFLIMVYSLKYVEGDRSAGRYWFLMSLFIAGMLLLTLADNLILFFVGWKIVGLCSYGLIGYYYSDDREHWIGGPVPFAFQKPSRAGLKALIVTTFGDIALLAGIIILYTYSGTFNFMELYQTAGVWLAQMGRSPGILAITTVLIVVGPLTKSAQFPFHEWLPEAMAGPTPVSALIHAATMVKAGVYLVARMLPVFFFAEWIASPGYPEALTFFLLVAVAGAITIVLGASQAMVAKELKKILAYSTMSTIGYMMLALGVAGLSPDTLVAGVSAGIFQLITHGVYKAGLFLCAGIAIQASGSIYISEMKLSRKSMRFTWLFMLIGGLALAGVPPLSGFWSKESILGFSWAVGQYLFFAVASVAVILTIFYTIRFMGQMFNGKVDEGKGLGRVREAAASMLLPCGILAALTVFIGLIGPWMEQFLSQLFNNYFTESLGLVVTGGVMASAASNSLPMDIILFIDSMLMIVIGAVPAYRIYVSHKSSAEDLISKHAVLRALHKFLWERWYIDAFYNKIFINGTLAMRAPLARYIEGTLDSAFNVGIPNLFYAASQKLRKIQTGILSINMLYFLMFLVAMVLFFLWLGVL